MLFAELVGYTTLHLEKFGMTMMVTRVAFQVKQSQLNETQNKSNNKCKYFMTR